jgi:lipoate-protein ligase A
VLDVFPILVLFPQITAVLDPEPHPAALNMALDEALLRQASVPTLRVYGWLSPAVSFGYFGRYADVERAAAGREVVRRWTGGGLVEHGEDLTYTLIVPRDAEFVRQSALESYRLVHEQIAQWLADRGMAARVAPQSAEEKSGACFASHVRYDIVADGAKLAGAAQRRTCWGLLHQGSIRLADDDRGSTLLSSVDTREFAHRFAQEVRAREITAALLQSAQQIAEEKYGTESWLRKF